MILKKLVILGDESLQKIKRGDIYEQKRDSAKRNY